MHLEACIYILITINSLETLPCINIYIIHKTQRKHTWDNIIDVQENCTFNTCKTTKLHSIKSAIPIANRIILEIK